MTFEEYVAGWEALVSEIETLKAKMKPLADKEMAMRKAIADSLKAGLGDQLKEGVNNWQLPDGRLMKFTYKVDRKIDESEIVNTRTAFGTLNDVDISFDDLLRVKYELEKKMWNGLGDHAKVVVSRMIIAKDAAPELKVE